MFSISQLSYWAAQHLGDTGLQAMKDRGRLQVGKVADITIFDSETVTDNATYRAGEHGLPSTGIPYVIVNGTVVVRDSEVLADVKPGQPIRFPVEADGRFVSVDVNRWINENTISRRTLPTVDDMGVTKALEQEGPQKDGSLRPEIRRNDLQGRTLTEFARAQANMPSNAHTGLLFSEGPPMPHSVFCPIHRMLEPAITVRAEMAQR